MNDTHKVIRGSSIRVIGLAANTAVAFFLMPFLVHSLGDRIYGYWALIGAVLGYYGVLDLGIVSAVQFQVAKALGEKDATSANRTISTSFYAFAALGSVILVITMVLAFLSHRLISNSSDAALFRSVLLIMGLGFAVGFPGRAFIGAISAHLRWDLLSSVTLAVLLLRTIAIVIAIKAGGGMVHLAVATVLGDALMYVIYYFILKRIQHQFRLSPALATIITLKEILRYSAFTLIIKISDQLRFYVHVLIVSAFLSVSAVTHYAIASRLALSFRDLMIALLGILSPWFSLLLGNKDYQAIRRVFVFGTKVSVSVSTTIACCMILYGREFIERWMGKSYLDAYWPLAFLVGGIFFDVSQLPSVSYMYGVSRHRFLAYMTLLEGTANGILSLYLVRIYGLTGVALGALIPMAAFWLFIQPLYVCRHVGLSTRTYYLGLFGRAAGVTSMAVIVPWLLVFRWIVRPSLVSIGVLAACQTGVALLVAYLLVLDAEERQSVLRTFTLLRARRTEVPISAPEAY